MYLASLKVKHFENQGVGISSFFVIEMINVVGHSPISWILDSGTTSYICVYMQDLEGSRLHGKREVVLQVRN